MASAARFVVVFVLLVSVARADSLIPCASVRSASADCSDPHAIFGRCFVPQTCVGTHQGSGSSFRAECNPRRSEAGKQTLNVTLFTGFGCKGAVTSTIVVDAGECVSLDVGPTLFGCSSGGPSDWPDHHDNSRPSNTHTTTLAVMFLSAAFCIAILLRVFRMRRMAAALRAPIPNIHGRRGDGVDEVGLVDDSSDDEMAERPPTYQHLPPPPTWHDDQPPEYDLAPADAPPGYELGQMAAIPAPTELTGEAPTAVAPVDNGQAAVQPPQAVTGTESVA